MSEWILVDGDTGRRYNDRTYQSRGDATIDAITSTARRFGDCVNLISQLSVCVRRGHEPVFGQDEKEES